MLEAPRLVVVIMDRPDTVREVIAVGDVCWLLVRDDGLPCADALVEAELLATLGDVVPLVVFRREAVVVE